jgi:hypothetical protein
MANVVGNVLAGKPNVTGGVLIAPTGTALPTTAVAAPNVAFVSAGYIGDDGLSQTIDRSTTKIRAWGGDIVRVLQTEVSVTYKFTFLESLNTGVLKAVYGDSNVAVTAATSTTGTLRSVTLTSAELGHKEFIFEIKDGLARIRVVVPNGQITEVGEVKYSDGEVIAYQVTIEAFPDSAGAQAYQYMDDGVFV